MKFPEGKKSKPVPIPKTRTTTTQITVALPTSSHDTTPVVNPFGSNINSYTRHHDNPKWFKIVHQTQFAVPMSPQPTTKQVFD